MRLVRDHCIKFLYQCESEKIYFYSQEHQTTYLSHAGVSDQLGELVTSYCLGLFDKLSEIDHLINELSDKWPVERMPVTDRLVVRLAAYELLHTKIPTKVILNEAVELAKIYGTDKSSRFVNGVLDRLAKSARSA